VLVAVPGTGHVLSCGQVSSQPVCSPLTFYSEGKRLRETHDLAKITQLGNPVLGPDQPASSSAHWDCWRLGWDRSMHPRPQGFQQSLLSDWVWTELAWLLPPLHLAKKPFCCGAHKRLFSSPRKEWPASCPSTAAQAQRDSPCISKRSRVSCPVCPPVLL
jgi:hypothetical protein